MYIVTGGAGFIGSVLARKLNSEGIDDIIIVDELSSSDRWKNLRKIKYIDYLHKDKFLKLIEDDKLTEVPQAILHMGACSSTTERDADYMLRNNYQYTKSLAEYALKNNVRFIYASSAATYGAGENGYSDEEDKLDSLSPLNVYGYSKHLFDCYALRTGAINQIAGLKFFNVFGPNEYHKDDMRSVALKSYLQIKEQGNVKLFRSYKPEFKDGEQKRDFVYVKDCVDTMWWLLNKPDINGIFNLGSGKARSWNDLVKAVYAALGKDPNIEYIEMPVSLRNQYQYYTEADMQKLNSLNCPVKFHSLEDAVKDYVQNYLESSEIYI